MREVGGDFEGVLEFRRQGEKKKGQQWLERQKIEEGRLQNKQTYILAKFIGPQ